MGWRVVVDWCGMGPSSLPPYVGMRLNKVRARLNSPLVFLWSMEVQNKGVNSVYLRVEYPGANLVVL